MKKLLCALVVLFFSITAAKSQTFSCNGDFLFTRQVSPNTFVSKVDFISGDVNISNPSTITPATLTNATVQFGGFIWTQDWNNNTNFVLLRINNTGASTAFIITGIPTNTDFNNAGVDKNGNMYILSSTNNNNGTVNMYTINLSSGNPTTATTTAVTFPGLANGNSIIWGDITTDPSTNRVYCWYHPTAAVTPLVGLYEITNISTTPTLTKIGALAQPQTMGSIFFNDRGQLFAYGSSTLGGTQDRIFIINKANGSIVQYGVPDIGVAQSDGCECVFRVSLDREISAPVINVSRCGSSSFDYIFTPRNYTSALATGITLTDVLDNRLSYSFNAATLQTQLQAIYGGSVTVALTSTGGGTNNSLVIANMSIPQGQNSFTLPVLVDARKFTATATISQQASLSGIAVSLGGPTEVSNYPVTFNPKDATPVVINLSGTRCLPPIADNFTNQPMPQGNAVTAIPPISAADPDGTVTGYTIVTIPTVAQGVLLVNGVAVTAGQSLTPAQISQLQFDPASTFTGTASFTFTATDNAGNLSNTAIYKLPVISLPPVASNIMENSMPNTNGATPIQSLSAADADGTISNYSILTIPGGPQGILSLSGVPVTIGQTLTPAQISQLQFDPAPAFTGNASFTYRATDNGGNTSNVATYTIPVTATATIQRPPLVNNIVAQPINNSLAATGISPLSATDLDGSVTTYTISSLPSASHGILLLSGVPVTVGQVLTPAQIIQLQFDPVATFIGSASFTYTATDNSSLIGNTATYTIPVVNTPPEAVNIKTTAPYNGSAAAIVPLSGSDGDGTVTSYTITTVPTAAQGVLSISCPVTPTGATCSGGFADLTPAVLTANPGGILLTPAQAAGIRFDPGNNFSGAITFNYFVTDNNSLVGNSSSYAITIDNNPPVSNDITVAAMPNTNGATALTALSSSDPDGTITIYTILSLPPAVGGVLSLSGVPVTAGQVLTPAQISSLQFDPAANYTGILNFTYTATDNSGNESNIANYNIPVSGVGNLPPIANNISVAAMPNTNGVTNITAMTGTDPDGTISNYTITVLPAVAQGVLSIPCPPTPTGATCTGGFSDLTAAVLTANGGAIVLTPTQATGLRFDPAAGFAGTATFSYDNTDNLGAQSNTAIYSIPVTGTPPVAVPIIAPVMPHTNAATAIPALIASDVDGTISFYTIETLPPAAQGVLFVNGIAATIGQVLTPAQITQLQFDPVVTYTGNVMFNYHATDNAGFNSNSTTYTLPVTGLPPVSVDIITNKLLNSASATPIAALSSSDADGTISSYTINSIPPASQGVLLLSGVPITIGQSLTPAQISQLQFDPAAGFIGNVIFNYTSFDNSGALSNVANYLIPIGSSQALPADQLILTANLSGEVVTLNWKTVSENNTAYFELERSTDNRNFTKIGSNINAAGYNSSETRYSRIDNTVGVQNVPALYYRVKLFDLDGSLKYSNIVMVQLDGAGVKVWPNPFGEVIQVSVKVAIAANLSIRITDMNGRLVYHRNFSIARGTSQISLDDVGHIAKGMYSIEVTNQDTKQKSVFKVNKQ
ncbi:MAG: T9SS type A sorting domain-containing protein [Chitinophagaceae bacterium]